MPNENNSELQGQIWRGRSGVLLDGRDFGAKPTPAPAPSFETHVREIMTELGDLLVSKHQRYGSKNISQAPGGAENGLRVRIWDKIARLNNLLENPDVDPGDESFTDTLMDLANYAAIFILVRNKKWPE